MKKILLITFVCLLGNLAFSQTIVPTTVTKKVAILEEYTGMHCFWCPYGHKIANEIAAANSGKFYAINIHQGYLSVPSGSEPDFRTSWGDALVNQAKITGYPSGSINRRTFNNKDTTAKNRVEWTGLVNTVIAEDSPVNIAIDASLDPNTRVLTVLVELYYTDSAAAANTLSENYLNIAILQDDVLGPQTGGSSGNPTAVRGSLYNHTHMLRTLLTKQWGDTIKIRKGFITKTITHTVPASYSGIPAKLQDLSVVAFVTKTKQEIFTGAKDNDLLPSNSFARLTAAYTNPVAKGWCSTTTGNVELTVTNGGTFTITDFKASLTPKVSDGSTPANIVKTFSGSLAPNQSAILNFPLASQNGISSFFFPSKLYDIKAGNVNKFNKAAITGSTASSIVHIPADKVTSFPFSIDFESSTVGTVYRVSDFSNPRTVQGSNATIGGFGKSERTLFFNFYVLAKDVEASIVLKKLDLSTFTTNQSGLRFSYAHALSRGDETDKLSVEVSTDCGANWTSIWSKTGTNLKTSEPNRNSSNQVIQFLPTKAEQWKQIVLPLNKYAQSEVLIKFKGVSGYGNNLLIDDIKLSPKLLSTNELFSGKNSFTIFPNPASGQVTLSLIQDEANKTENKTVSIRIFDVTGRNIFKSSTTTEMLRDYKINTQEFAQGVYFVEVSSENQNKITKLVIR